MDVSKSNPQKYYMKLICDGIYYLGLGDIWYEKKERSVFQKWLYLLWAVISNLYTFAIFFDELLAHCRLDLNDKEQNDLMQFTLAHSMIMGKILCNYLYKEDITKMLERLLESAVFQNVALERACAKRFLFLSVMAVGMTFMTLFAATADGIRAYFAEGITIRTEVVYYPAPTNSGIIINIIRFFIIFHWFYAVAIMTLIDCICICSMVIVGYKFKILQAHFDSLREKIQDVKEGKEGFFNPFERYREEFVMGIKMHDEALRCAKNVQSALGNLYSVQVFENFVLLLMCLVKLVRVERNFIFLLANFLYIVSMIALTGAYMIAGGDITHEVAGVSSAIFHSGWEQVGGRDIRVLVVLALQRSQVPVYMYAFGILNMSYSNYISVIRSSYSFFAVMY